MNRESLIKALWPNTVVEEANLNVHISALRKAWQRSGEQHYIETLPRLGYRFIAPVTEVDGAAAISSISHPLAENGAGTSNQNAVRAVNNQGSRICAHDVVGRRRCVVGDSAARRSGLSVYQVCPPVVQRRRRRTNSPINIVLTTYPGRESQPAFSPDGNQIAFVWSGAKDDNTDVYVRLVDGELGATDRRPRRRCESRLVAGWPHNSFLSQLGRRRWNLSRPGARRRRA